jgi:hypothetical protein
MCTESAGVRTYATESGYSYLTFEIALPSPKVISSMSTPADRISFEFR